MNKIGRYEIARELGRGVTSTVYLAQDPLTDREVAIKLYHANSFKEDEGGSVFQRLFVNESLLAGRLTHPNIVGIYEASISDDYGYLVMEYVPGTTLERYTNAEQLLPVARVLEIIFRAARALDYAQRNGIIHRDIKPANIMLSSSGDVKVSDFGASLNTRSKGGTQVTGIGSLAYMSPEQTRDEPLTFHTDIYSLAVVLYRLLTGQLPFSASSDAGLIYQIQNLDATPPTRLRADLPPLIDVMIKRALAKLAGARYQTWEQFTNDLLKLRPDLEQLPAQTSPEERYAQARKLGFFKGFSDAELREVVTMGKWYDLPMGATLIREGDGGQAFYILVSGEVKVSKAGAILGVLHGGESFGEMTYLSKRRFKRSADVVSLTDVTVIEIDPDLLWLGSKSCQEKFQVAFFDVLVERLSAADERLVEILNDARVMMF